MSTCCMVFCFFKQKTAYEMRISDWSSDVCSSDLGALAVDADDLGHARLHEDLGARDPSRAHAGDHDSQRVHRLVDDAQRVLQRGERHHGGAVLVVVEDGDVEELLQPVLDLEAGRRGDVLEVDAAEHRRDAHRSEEHTSELQSLMRTSYAVFCL